MLLYSSSSFRYPDNVSFMCQRLTCKVKHAHGLQDICPQHTTRNQSLRLSNCQLKAKWKKRFSSPKFQNSYLNY